MLNEALQWLVLASILVMVLGLYRQVAATMPAAFRSSSGGPSVGRRLPRNAIEKVNAAFGSASTEGLLLAFVSENCQACRQLLASLEDSVPAAVKSRLVLVAHDPSPAFEIALLELNIPVIPDVDSELFEACRVTATPLIVEVDASGKVLWKEVTHDVARAAVEAS